MSKGPTPIEVLLEEASAIVRTCGVEATVTAILPLHGGMVNRVEEWRLDGPPGTLVAKVGAAEEAAGLRYEFRTLCWMREQAPEFPMPAAYGLAEREGMVYLLLERLPGRNLAEAQLTPQGAMLLQMQMAIRLAQLHAHRRESYGSVADDESCVTWLEWFGPRLHSNVEDAWEHLPDDTRQVCTRLLDRLPDLLPESGQPTLVHGDVWATNIIVDDADPDAPRLSGFIDGGGLLADVEYELAYLIVFNTADAAFFTTYRQFYPLRDGFLERARIYWLNTLLLHVWMFGDDYLPRCEMIAREVGEMMG